MTFFPGWTKEQERELERLWAEGHTSRRIAEIMGLKSRNQVIGKAHRMGLALRVDAPGGVRKRIPVYREIKTRIKANRAAQKPPKLSRPTRIMARSSVIPRKPKPKPIQFTEAGDPISRHIAFLEAAPDECRFIAADPRADSSVCGHPVHARSLCEYHFRKCWVVQTRQSARQERSFAKYVSRT